ASGLGAVLARESGVREGEYLVAHDVVAGTGTGAEALVRMATAIERAWLQPTHRERVHRFVESSGNVQAVERDMYGVLVLGERPVEADAEEVQEVLTEVLATRGLGAEGEALQRRLRFARLE